MSDDRLQQLMEAWRDDQLTVDQTDELNQLLRDSEEARREFSSESMLHSLLHVAVAENAVEHASEIAVATSHRASKTLREDDHNRWLAIAAAVAASLLLVAAGSWLFAPTTVKPIAKLVSAEDAAWESALPTIPGSELPPGSLKLISGIATIRFHSGAAVVLEGPAHLVIESTMRAKLVAGAAVIDVPDSAIGFLIETPDGYAVDHGTRFSVLVDESQNTSSFEVLSGEISVHAPQSTDEVRLKEKQAADIRGGAIETLARLSQEGTVKRREDVLRIGTGGRSTSIVRNNDPLMLNPDLLMAKRDRANDSFDRHSLIAFSTDNVDLNSVQSVRLRLNLVPSGVGLGALLPTVNRFAIYGKASEGAQAWNVGCNWDDAPKIENCLLLGTFEIPRSRKRGVFGIDTPELLDFLKSNAGKPVTFIVTRLTTEARRGGLVHAFGSDTHPEASGPILEFHMR